VRSQLEIFDKTALHEPIDDTRIRFQTQALIALPGFGIVAPSAARVVVY